MDFTALAKGNAYNFSSFAAKIWPDVRNAVYDGSVGYTTASSFGPVASQHVAALPYLPSGTTNDPKALNYLVFIINGTQRIMAWEWLNPTTIVETKVNTRTVVLSGATAADDARIRQAMAGIGLIVSSIS